MVDFPYFLLCSPHHTHQKFCILVTNMFRLQFLAIAGMLMLIACSNGVEVQTPPAPTPDIPVLRDGEVIGLVQERLLSIPGNHIYPCINLAHMVANYTSAYVGDGVWEVWSPSDAIFGWEVFEQSKIVDTLKGPC